jgi:NAD(P)-dependent dehydrogenase (short-subunit alcohol dehydrogenase family)
MQEQMSKTVLITGTSNGFGKDIALTLAEGGHRIFATMRDINNRNRAVAKELQGRGIDTLELDVTDNASVGSAFKALSAKTGDKLDVLVNNAGIASGGVSETFTPEQLREMFEVNVFGIQRLMRAALPQMRASGSGLIINIGSILGRVTIPFFGLYGASKHAVEAMTESYRYELSQLGVDVVLVQPGPFPTKLYDTMQRPSDPSRAQQYGEVATLPEAITSSLGAMFSAQNAPDPHEVAIAIAKLIDTPAGQRPERVVVGGAFGADVANSALQPLQAQMVSGFDLDRLTKLKLAG